jgi:MYXO-CTERM domain-containing protein
LRRGDGTADNGCDGLTDAHPRGAPRGEGVVAAQYGLDFTGRGNLVQGGGGGVCHNSGGGGGGHIALGGLGGRSWGGETPAALASRMVGGLGGARSVYSFAQHLTLGGGGGAGHGNNDVNTAGGAGGGVLFVRAGSVAGAGAFSADGVSVGTNSNDAQGGGGAAGAIILRAQGAVACGGLNANGGQGGTVNVAVHGPGGGGSGGLIARQATAGVCATSVTGGLAGTQTDANAPDGIYYGAQPTPANRAQFVGAVVDVTDAFAVTTPAQGATVGPRPALSGTTTPNTRVRVSVDGVVVATVTADGMGAWTFTPTTPLTSGGHTLDAQAEGSILITPTRAFIVDAVAPTIALTAPANGAVVSNTRPPITGTAEPGATVTITINGAVVGTATAAPVTGAWSFTPAAALPQGSNTASATATDGAGNTSQPVSSTFTVDSVAPAAVAITTPANGAVISNARPPISGTAEPGSTVTVTGAGGVIIGTATAAPGTGAWSVTPATDLPQGSNTVSATARDAAGNTSQPSSTTFTIDTIAPAAVAISAPANGALISDPTPEIRGTAEPGSTVTVTIGGVVIGTATAAAGTGAWSVTPTTDLPQGSNTASATARDAAGNTSQPTSTTFTVDTIAPAAVAINTPADGANLGASPAAISGTTEPGALVAVNVNGMALGTTTAAADGSWSVAVATPLDDGAYTVTATATDAAGNTSPAATSAFNISRAFVDITTPAPGAATNDATPTISGTATPGATLNVQIDGVSVGMVTAGADGSWSLEVPADLMEGLRAILATTTVNGTPAQDTASITIDQTAPALDLVQPINGSTTNITTPVISGTSEPGAVITLDINGQPATVTADASGDWSYTPPAALPFGAIVITATATDAAGNRSMDSATITIVDDMGAPLDLTITSPANQAMISTGTPTLTGVTAPGATVEIFADGVSVGSVTAGADGSWSFMIPAASALADGAHTLEARATSGQDTATVAIDVTVTNPAMTPVVITAPAAGATTNDATPTISGTAAPGAVVEVFVDGMSIGTATADANGAWTIDAPMLMDGAREIDARVGGDEATVNITIDTAAPVTAVTSPTTGSTVMTGTPTITGTGEPGSTVVITIDGMEAGRVVVGPDGTWMFTPATPLGEGAHTIVVIGVDGAGNQGAPINIDLTIDLPGAMPMVAIATPAAGGTVTDATPTISGTATPGATVEIVVDGEVIGSAIADANGMWSFTPTAPLADGEHTVEARVTIDGESTSTGMIGFTVDAPAEEDAGGIIIGRESCASAPASAPGGAYGALLGLLGLLGLRRRRS